MIPTTHHSFMIDDTMTHDGSMDPIFLHPSHVSINLPAPAGSVMGDDRLEGESPNEELGLMVFQHVAVEAQDSNAFYTANTTKRCIFKFGQKHVYIYTYRVFSFVPYRVYIQYSRLAPYFP